MDWTTEVDELHRFFETYYLGTESSLDRVERALAPSFTMIGPDGVVSDRAHVLDSIVAGHGHTRSLSIEISDQLTVAIDAGLVVGTYIETHHLADRRNDRRTTVVFAQDPAGPNGVRWLHAQETWVP